MTGPVQLPPSSPALAMPDRSVRPVIEHALTDYGYSPETVQTLLDRLTAEARTE